MGPEAAGGGSTATGPTLEVETERGPDEARVKVRGEVDLASADLLTAALTDAIAESPMVVVDLSEVEFFDCRGLTAVLRARRAASARGGALCVGSASRAVSRVFELSRLSALLCGDSGETVPLERG